MSVGLPERDVGIITFVNGMGFVCFSQLKRRFDREVSRRRLGDLCRRGYLRYDRIFFQGEGIYRATAAGVKAAGHFLRPLKTVNLSTYRHDLLVVDLSLLLEETTGGSWISERVLKRRLVRGRREPLPDGLLTWPDREVAVELELSVKPFTRLARILRSYTRSAYDEVWYVTGRAQLGRRLEGLLAELPFVRLANWEGGSLRWVTSSLN
ncbi:MAG: hypothetical protein M0Z41_18665 [Peptococcaceae bacterium]|jgi:hypothetical protein|nr:hypothetical protein [Peptococcaceae bacterium]